MRTDRRYICGYCRVRFAESGTCPGCGSARVYDMARPRRRRAGVALARRYQTKASRFERALDAVFHGYFGGGGVALAVGAAVVGLIAGASLTDALAIGVIAFALGGLVLVTVALPVTAVATFVRWLGRTAEQERGPAIPKLRLLPPPEPDAAAVRESVVGVVHVRAAITSPLSGAVGAAVRIVGRGPTGELDEALAGEFDVIVRDGPPVRVEADPCTLALPTPVALPQTRRAKRGRLARFMRERGACPHLGPLVLAETVLRDGDAVEVTGTAQQEMRPGGYRGSVGVVFRDHPGSPLVIGLPDA